MSVPPPGVEQRAGRRCRRCTIGVLGLQGDVREHLGALDEVGAAARAVRRVADLRGIDGMIIPGGESTTLSMLLESSGLLEPMAEALAGGLPVLGTCAGLILVASEVVGGRADQVSLGLMDCAVRRNAYGSQAQSFEAALDATKVDEMLAAAAIGRGEDALPAEKARMPAVFIRAPVIERTGPGVEVLVEASHGPQGRDGPVPVMARQGQVLVTTFHPELTPDRRVHRLLADMVWARTEGAGVGGRDAAVPGWGAAVPGEGAAACGAGRGPVQRCR